jgi:hypothetical protein
MLNLLRYQQKWRPDMANTNQHIDINSALAGMKVINEEKAEIALILHLLSPYLYEIAQSELYATDRMLATTGCPYKSLEIFTVQSGNKDSLEFSAVREEVGFPGFSFRVIFENGSIVDRTTILDCRARDRVEISPERLGKKMVGTCRHDLLPLLMEETVKRCTNSLLLSDLEAFYAAAKRSAVILEEPQ